MQEIGVGLAGNLASVQTTNDFYSATKHKESPVRDGVFGSVHPAGEEQLVRSTRKSQAAFTTNLFIDVNKKIMKSTICFLFICGKPASKL